MQLHRARRHEKDGMLDYAKSDFAFVKDGEDYEPPLLLNYEKM